MKLLRDERIEREERATGLATSQVSVDLGLSNKERRKYSLLKAVRSLASGKPLDGLEAEASAAEAQRVGRDPSGVFVPAEVLATRAIDQRDPMETRANAANVASDGGYLVAQTIDTSNLVPYLRNQAVTLSLGARVISGLTGDVTIPRVTGASSVYWVSETGTITGSGFDLTLGGTATANVLSSTGTVSDYTFQGDGAGGVVAAAARAGSRSDGPRTLLRFFCHDSPPADKEWAEAGRWTIPCDT